MSNLRQNGVLRWNPSYLRRQGQMTLSQKKAFRAHWRTFGIEYRYGETVQLETNGPLFLEIGFGMGENLIYQAKTNPEALILGIEVHKPGIGAALKKISAENIKNIRVMRGDARLILSDYLDQSVRFDRISVLFPDPWPDDEKAHRRIIQRDFIQFLEKKTRPGGLLHIATDVDRYAKHSVNILNEFERWKRTSDLPRSDFRGPTRYETRGLEAGHSIYDLIFRFLE